MACDILNVLISIIIFEFIFSVGGHIIDHFKNALKQYIVSALICTRN